MSKPKGHVGLIEKFKKRNSVLDQLRIKSRGGKKK